MPCLTALSGAVQRFVTGGCWSECQTLYLKCVKSYNIDVIIICLITAGWIGPWAGRAAGRLRLVPGAAWEMGIAYKFN